MAYVKDKTGVRQTATNAAMSLVTSFVQAGLITDRQEAVTMFQEERDSIFDDLAVLVDADNAAFAAADTGKKSYGQAKNYAKKSKGTVGLEQALATELNFGKFKGCTLEEVAGMSLGDTAAYGHDKPGLAYIKWLSTNENNSFIAERAGVVLEARKASSDTEGGE